MGLCFQTDLGSYLNPPDPPTPRSHETKGQTETTLVAECGGMKEPRWVPGCPLSQAWVATGCLPRGHVTLRSSPRNISKGQTPRALKPFSPLAGLSVPSEASAHTGPPSPWASQPGSFPCPGPSFSHVPASLEVRRRLACPPRPPPCLTPSSWAICVWPQLSRMWLRRPGYQPAVRGPGRSERPQAEEQDEAVGFRPRPPQRIYAARRKCLSTVAKDGEVLWNVHLFLIRQTSPPTNDLHIEGHDSFRQLSTTCHSREPERTAHSSPRTPSARLPPPGVSASKPVGLRCARFFRFRGLKPENAPPSG